MRPIPPPHDSTSANTHGRSDKVKVLAFDCETDGLLHSLTRVHCLVIHDVGTGARFRFRRHEGGLRELRPVTEPGVMTEVAAEDTIAEGIRMLEEADVIVGHNSVQFDVRAIQKVYPGFLQTSAKVPLSRDTLVYCRVAFPDIEGADWRRVHAKVFPPELVGSHSLDAWGHRVALYKGDYGKAMRAVNRDPWGHWNLDQEDYCDNDVAITVVLWVGLQNEPLSQMSLDLEHDITDLLATTQANGFPFDAAAALRLKSKLDDDLGKLVAEIKPIYGKWFKPAKKWRVAIEWDDPDGANRQQFEYDKTRWSLSEETLKAPRPDGKRALPLKYRPLDIGMDFSRPVWGAVVRPKKARRKKILFRETHWPNGTVMPAHEVWSYYDPEAPYTPVEVTDFNPASRDQVIDRFQMVHGWTPKDFTEKGRPEVTDAVLRALRFKIPIAEKIAEVFFIRILLGRLATGPESWLARYNEATGKVHAYTNPGGTVSGRCSHSGPNINVTSVMEADVKLKDGTLNPDVVDENGNPRFECFNEDGSLKKKIILFGRKGEYGHECRSLFYTPSAWGVQLGVDLTGIETRALAEFVFPFDDGEMIKIVTDPKMDVHQHNKDMCELASRDIAKRSLYALLYGAGDLKLGATAYPELEAGDDNECRAAGREVRDKIMRGLPALKRAIDKVQGEAERGYLIGLDGRRLKCRSPHSALNLKLQSDAALIAKRWAVLSEWYLLDAGFDHGWAGHFALMAFVHDELAFAVRREISGIAGELVVKAAADAGLDLGWQCPVAAKAKIGSNWSDTH